MPDTRRFGSLTPAAGNSRVDDGAEPTRVAEPAPAREPVQTQMRVPAMTSVMPASSAHFVTPDRNAPAGGTEIQVLTHQLPNDRPLDPRLILLREPGSERSAAYRVLRHHLSRQGDPKIIAVTSARAGEGKTTCALNLALTLAERGRGAVLLIEGNLHAPQLADVFHFQPPWCFAEQLAAHREQPMMPWVVAEVVPLGLRVAAVNPTARWRPVLDALAFFIAIERFRMTNHDFIIIDGPPVLGSADINMIQDAADGVLLVGRAGQTRERDVRRALDQIKPGTVLGVVLHQ